MKAVESIITLPTQEKFVNPALAFIRSTAASCGFSGTALNEIEVASEEALTNVIMHAYEGHADETFEITVRFNESDFMIMIHEKGMPFNPERVADYDPEKLESKLSTEGLGVYLMKKTMDIVKYENLGRDGKLLTLIKHITDGHIKQIIEKEGNEVLVKNSQENNIDVKSVDIRLALPEDALEISRCAYKSYGYTYEPFIYYPEKIAELNKVGRLVSVVACSITNSDILGHMALKFRNPEDKIAEMGVAFVKPEYRKSGVFNSLNYFCHDIALERKLYGYFGRAVTSHIGSQVMADKIGYKACGFFMGLFPDDVDFRSLSGKIKQKESGILVYRHIYNEEVRKISAPQRHKNTISKIFDSFNIKVEFLDAFVRPINHPSLINVDMIPVLNVADVEVTRIGADILNELKNIFHNLRLRHMDAIFLHLDMEDPCSSYVAEECRGYGFFFSGVLPFGINNRHKMILQYMNNLEINYEMIKPYAKEAVEVLNYVCSDANSIDV